MAFLRKQVNRNGNSSSQNQNTETVNQSLTSSTPMKPCRYGINCSRVDCHFTHSDRKSPTVSSTAAANQPAPGTSPSSSSTMTNTTINQRTSPWFPLQFSMEIDDETNELTVDLNGSLESGVDGIEADSVVTLATDDSERSGSNEKERRSSENTISSTRSSLTPTSIVSTVSQKKFYKLAAVVCQVVNGTQKNLVALIHVGGKYHKMKLDEMDESHSQWYIFNDFR